jgi:hypothetical protein
MNTIILVLLEESVEDSVVFDFYGYSTFPIKHGRQHHQELKTWGSATPGTPSARSALLAEDHMRCGGIWPEILGQLQLPSALGTIVVDIPGAKTHLRDKMISSDGLLAKVRPAESTCMMRSLEPIMKR